MVCNMTRHGTFKDESHQSRISIHHLTLQHTTTHCNTLQHAATHYNALQHAATRCKTLQHTFHVSLIALFPFIMHNVHVSIGRPDC